MSCPTCSHTAHGIGHGMSWCPRCGTLLGCPDGIEVDVPALVNRCRRFANHFRADEDGLLMQSWEVLGVAESIETPAQRKDSDHV